MYLTYPNDVIESHGAGPAKKIFITIVFLSAAAKTPFHCGYNRYYYYTFNF